MGILSCALWVLLIPSPGSWESNTREINQMTNKPVFQNMTLQPIAGQWRAGSAPRKLDVTDPFTGEQLLSLAMATREDLDEAYRKAAEAQVAWAAVGPSARGDVMRRAVDIFDQRKDEIVDWLIRESGSTRIKAQIEWGAARAIIQESASLPGRSHGRILPSDVPGK